MAAPITKPNNAFDINKSSSSDSNLFLRIDNIDDLQAGDKVIITNQYGGTLDHFGGNPIYLCARDYGGQSAMGDKHYFTGSLNDYQVLNVGKVGNYFTFQFTYTYSDYWDKVICKNKYLCYRQSDGTWDDKTGKVYLYGDLYFTDSTSNENAQWKITSNTHGDGFFDMQRSGEENDTCITFESGVTRSRFWYGGHSGDYGVRIFKYINLNEHQHVFNINNISEPNRTTFYQGETVDLSGLEFNLYLFASDFDISTSTDIAADALYTVHSKYDDERNLYSSVSVSGSGNNAIASFTYLGLGYRVYIQIIQESENTTQYHLLNYSMLDYRGTYYFGHIISSYSVYILNGNDSYIGGVTEGLSMDIATEILDVPNSAGTNVIRSRFQVKRVIVGGESNPYLYNYSSSKYVSYDDNNKLCYVEENELSDKEIFSVINNKPVLNGDRYIVYATDEFNVSTNSANAVSIFKLMPKTDFYTELDTFKRTFFNKIQCESIGETNFSSQDWLDTKDAFDDLTVDAQGYLANLTYTHNAEASGSLNDLVDRYDYILSKYPSTYVDYMNRREAAYSDFYNNSQNIFNNRLNQQSGSIVIIVLAISLIMVASIIFIIKKRKVIR